MNKRAQEGGMTFPTVLATVIFLILLAIGIYMIVTYVIPGAQFGDKCEFKDEQGQCMSAVECDEKGIAITEGTCDKNKELVCCRLKENFNQTVFSGLEKNQVKTFVWFGQEHKITVKDITDDKVTLILESEPQPPIEISLTNGKGTKKVSLSEDKTEEDLQIDVKLNDDGTIDLTLTNLKYDEQTRILKGEVGLMINGVKITRDSTNLFSVGKEYILKVFGSGDVKYCWFEGFNKDSDKHELIFVSSKDPQPCDKLDYKIKPEEGMVGKNITLIVSGYAGPGKKPLDSASFSIKVEKGATGEVHLANDSNTELISNSTISLNIGKNYYFKGWGTGDVEYCSIYIIDKATGDYLSGVTVVTRSPCGVSDNEKPLFDYQPLKEHIGKTLSLQIRGFDKTRETPLASQVFTIILLGSSTDENCCENEKCEASSTPGCICGGEDVQAALTTKELTYCCAFPKSGNVAFVRSDNESCLNDCS